MKSFNFIYCHMYHGILLCLSVAFIGLMECKVIDLTDENFDHFISTYELVFVNFHAEWCPYSARLAPILQECDQILSQEFKEPNKVLIGRLDCDLNSHISSRYKIVKYPTLKTFLNGKVMKKEYRGTRNKDSISQYIRELLSDPVIHIVYKSFDDLNAIHYNKSAVIGYFRELPETNPKYSAFRRVATDLQGYCHFYWVTNSPFLADDRHEMLAFKSYRSTSQSEYDFIYETYDELSSWSTYLCIPIVREITFDNAEEIIEEGLPLVILFHKSDDEHSLEMFKSIIQKELVNQTSYVNFVTADGTAFSHPLSHMEKSEKDLPLIALDSFQHMYLFPKFQDLNKTHILANFIEDMKSGKLHRRYHFGEDYLLDYNDDSDDEVTTFVTTPSETIAKEVKKNDNEIYQEFLTPVATSVFKNLAPSEHRYSLRKDEL